MKHTPGPWKYDEVWALIKGPKGEEIAAIHSGQNDGERLDRNIAYNNAALIAAAPDLVEALESALVSTVNGNALPEKVREGMIAALIEAKG